MTREQTGGLIGATFGLAFIQVNAAAVLPGAACIAFRVLAVAAFLAVIRRLRRRPAPLPAGTAAQTDFGRRYRFVVAAEVLAGAAGILVINDLLHTPRATVAWIALVVGLHFFGLAAVWRMPSLRWLAAGMSVCGAVGLVLCACGVPQAAVAAVAGIVPGAMLLGSVGWSFRGDAHRGTADGTTTAGAAAAPGGRS